jgi:hypothetical protein
MKKLLVLSALLGLLALPVFANHVSIDMGGDMTFGVMSDFDTAVVDPDLTWDVIVGIDDYNSFTWSLKDIALAPLIGLDKALVTTDIGMWLGLPVGIMVNWGYDDPARNQYESTSGYANEELGDFSPVEYWGLDFLVSAGMVEVELAFDPLGADGKLLAGLAVKEPVPGLNAEVYYFQNQSAGDVFDEGNLAFAAEYATEVSMIALDIGAGFLYNLADTGDAWGYGIGLAADTGMFGATVGLAGNETDALATLSATATAAPVDMATIYVGLLADLQDAAAETLDSVDLGVNAHVGIVECYVGYLITSTGAVDGTYNAPTALTDGGMYIKFDVDY